MASLVDSSGSMAASCERGTGLGRVCGMKQRAGFARARMTFKNSGGAAAACETRLRRSPRFRSVFGTAQIGHSKQQIIVRRITRVKRGMIVVMAYISQKDRLGLGLESGIFEWRRRRGGPP